uniref:NADH dehydrogenase subunit 3 n=1 Tax=Anurida maritima TaxID=64695 RepID=UPI0022FD871A|nr:NADH dehydrogenase subunit 3 [Anurida maritima]WBK17674.1 NADH dehydrogenase subunit 3 [Anurida maritima]
MTLIFILSTVLPLTLIMANLILYKKNYLSREKPSPFECGFDPKNPPRNSFSLSFYLISLVFLIFDIEIALILPAPLLLTWSASLTNLSLMLLLFLIILILGLFYEWNEGALNWLM